MNYHFEINLSFSQTLTAKNKEEAIEQLEKSFYEDYGIDLKENEYRLVKD